VNVGQAKDNEQPQSSYNPLDKYPAPPFKRDSQSWPGLASRMDPPPDHGERTYRGSGRLTGRKALITGGDSGMGGAARHWFVRMPAKHISESGPRRLNPVPHGRTPTVPTILTVPPNYQFQLL
jgi:hypothetical protein